MKQTISTSDAPQAIGPYSQAVRVGNLLFLSGQIPLDPKSMAIVGKTVEEQTEQVMKNLEAVLKSQKLSFDNLARTTIYLMDMGSFPKVNEVYGKFLTAPYPARATVQVAKLPKDALVEIDGIAVYPS